MCVFGLKKNFFPAKSDTKIPQCTKDGPPFQLYKYDDDNDGDDGDDNDDDNGD